MNSLNQMPNNGMNWNTGNFNVYPNQIPNQTPNYFGGMNANNFPRYSIIQVRGQNGAEALQMAPNSKVLLLDETDPLIWFVQTDGAGYKTVTPYTISPYQPAPPVDLNSIEQRLSALEEKINAKSYNGANKQRKQTGNRVDDAVESTNSAS